MPLVVGHLMVQFVIFIRRRSFLKKFIGCNFGRDRFEKRVNEVSFLSCSA